jgi:S-methylmethionine-dependent homocysteine/selenocysteine methylase
MARYRSAPPIGGAFRPVLTDGGLETTLIFGDGIDLPHFAACELLRSEAGRIRLASYYDGFASLAAEAGAGFLLDTATWRANPDWTSLLGYSRAEFEEVNAAAIALAVGVRDRHDSAESPVLIAGVIGPRGDGYRADERQGIEQAREYSAAQTRVFAAGEVDLIEALTLNYPEEAAGVALAARDAGMPILVSFTVETDGRLASGDSLREGIEFVDAGTGGYPLGYLVNCSHPEHLPEDLIEGEAWAARVVGCRPNASRRSHAELDEAPDLDSGDPDELAAELAQLRAVLPSLTVLGGCCGTDSRHIAAIARACL